MPYHLVFHVIFSHLSLQATEILIHCPQDLIKRVMKIIMFYA